MDTNRKVFGDNGMTARAKLGSAIGIHPDKLSPSLFRFGREYAEELPPTGIGNGFCKTMIAQHLINIKFLNGNYAKLVNYPSCFLMQEVMSPVENALIDAGNNLPGSPSFSRPLLHLGELPLGFSECLLVCPEEAWIMNSLASRKGSKAIKPYINAYRSAAYWQRLWFIFNGKAGIPLASLPSDGAGLGLPEGLPVELNFDVTDLRKLKITIESEAKLCIGETIIAVKTFEARIAWLFSSLNSPEEGLERLVQSICDILKHLRVDIAKTRAFLLEFYDTLALLEIRKTFLPLLPAITALFQQPVIQPTTLIKLRLKQVNLVICWEKTIFKSLLHRVLLYLKERKLSSRFIPPLKEWAFSA